MILGQLIESKNKELNSMGIHEFAGNVLIISLDNEAQTEFHLSHPRRN